MVTKALKKAMITVGNKGVSYYNPLDFGNGKDEGYNDENVDVYNNFWGGTQP